LKLSGFAYLADQNIHADVIAFLRSRGLDIVTTRDSGLDGADDQDVLRAAFSTERVVLSHDSDCGTLAVASGQPVKGIVYVRPGHIAAEFTIQTLQAILDLDLNIAPPFIVVAVRKKDNVRIRIRLI
jgi:predicted nuclease of predicted toxin-antitoxin system